MSGKGDDGSIIAIAIMVAAMMHACETSSPVRMSDTTYMRRFSGAIQICDVAKAPACRPVQEENQ